MAKNKKRGKADEGFSPTKLYEQKMDKLYEQRLKTNNQELRERYSFWQKLYLPCTWYYRNLIKTWS